MIAPVPPALVAVIALVCFVAWLAGKLLARHVIARLVEQAAAYSSGVLVMVGPAVVLLVALR